MSNYLDNLAAKSLGHAEQVWPRLPSLFEPAVTGPASSLDFDDQTEDAHAGKPNRLEGSPAVADDEREAAGNGAVDLPVAAIVSHSNVPPSAADLNPLRPAPDDRNGLQSPRQSTAFDRIETAGRRRNAAADSEARIDADPAASDSTLRSSTLSEVPGIIRSESAPLVEIYPVREQRDAQDDSTAGKTEASHLSFGPGESTPALEFQIASDRLFQTQDGRENGQGRRQMDRRLGSGLAASGLESPNGAQNGSSRVTSAHSENGGSRPARFAAPDVTQAEPNSTIKVTIGRVEVRALFGDARSGRPERTKAKPGMTLEEYLKQRNGGQR